MSFLTAIVALVKVFHAIDAGAKAYEIFKDDSSNRTNKQSINGLVQGTFTALQLLDFIGTLSKLNLTISVIVGCLDLGRIVTDKVVTNKPWTLNDGANVLKIIAFRVSDIASLNIAANTSLPITSEQAENITKSAQILAGCVEIGVQAPLISGNVSKLIKLFEHREAKQEVSIQSTSSNSSTSQSLKVGDQKKMQEMTAKDSIYPGTVLPRAALSQNGSNSTSMNTRLSCASQKTILAKGDPLDEGKEELEKFIKDPLAFEEIPSFAKNSKDLSVICKITGKKIRHLQVPLGCDDTNVCYEKSEIENWFKLRPNEAPFGWPKNIEFSKKNITTCIKTQKTIDNCLIAMASEFIV